MTQTREAILSALDTVKLPDGGTLVARDLVRALVIDDHSVRFVIETPSAEIAKTYGEVRAQAEKVVAALPGVQSVSVALTAHSAPKAPPSLKVGRHPTPQEGRQAVPGVTHLLAVGSGKGGVGKSTVAANLSVALARKGLRVGLLDADIYGPSQPKMMGVDKRPASPDGKRILPLDAHGVKMISIGLMLKGDEAVIWRGPMLMGALQQLLTQVEWGALDVLIVDMPPGTGDIQLTLCSKFDVRGAVVVSTPQDVALLDARKALRAFETLKTPVLGLIENMSTFICPQCGHEEHIFGEGGVRKEATKQGLPFLGELPLSVEVRLAGDGGVPVAATDSPVANAYARIADKLIAEL
ncbi:Mrp/NBP35 family ATP-binding protein [Roseibaca sp. Y0-43]|uniref:Mrp/NBP35 family ATP-binding protein n=1 Tax=Roseibaca sp. Y0-43 TaxID=2816854 RepID=UPI001D0C9CA5|nr:Mrp/NBP35 family ATP-binding protein [Roseibaca sp. Y0-43]MCC1482356.1 Mrp/NBP35 family ATP-binding protein [Roseibaca sp. Y0-43]